MKKQGFDEMKAFCNEKGFELLNVYHEDNEKFYVIAVKKDPWKGVEFARYKFPNHLQFAFFKVKETKGEYLIQENGGELFKGNCDPITEQAYIEQLKKEAFERFGDIKEGDRVDSADGYQVVIEFNGFANDIQYSKEIDTLFIGGLRLYQQGKWATKLPERVKVELLKMDCDKYNDRATKHTLKFLVSEEMVLSKEVGKFLAERLEKYLNDEIK